MSVLIKLLFKITFFFNAKKGCTTSSWSSGISRKFLLVKPVFKLLVVWLVLYSYDSFFLQNKINWKFWDKNHFSFDGYCGGRKAKFETEIFWACLIINSHDPTSYFHAKKKLSLNCWWLQHSQASLLAKFLWEFILRMENKENCKKIFENYRNSIFLLSNLTHFFFLTFTEFQLKVIFITKMETNTAFHRNW